jgi:PA14 domain
MNHTKSSLFSRLAMLGVLSTAVSYAAPGWTLETFSSISGSQVSNLTSSSIFYAPTKSSVISSSVILANTADNYGTRIRGYVVPSVSGLYTFWESGDDAVQLFLSPDANPANKQLIAYHVAPTIHQEWTKFPTQRSRQIPLVAGQKYYIEALHKESTGGDNLSIAWTPPNAERALIPLQAMETHAPTSPYIGSAGLTRDVFSGISGATIADLSKHSSFYGVPANTSVLQSSQVSQDSLENYGTRIRGFLTPAVTASYTFWESGDDAVELYLSPTESPADKRLIASHTIATNPSASI